MHDKAVWDNSTELRRTVRDCLVEWGRWSQGGGSSLGYPKHQPWTTPGEESREQRALRVPVKNVDECEHYELIISTMAAATCHHRGAWLLKFRYVDGIEDQAAMTKHYNRKFKRNEPERMVMARLDEAEWVFANLL